ncbi:MAG: hypothetical protein AABY09_02190, partial [Nanoarchaeota archaeon]
QTFLPRIGPITLYGLLFTIVMFSTIAFFASSILSLGNATYELNESLNSSSVSTIAPDNLAMQESIEETNLSLGISLLMGREIVKVGSIGGNDIILGFKGLNVKKIKTYATEEDYIQINGKKAMAMTSIVAAEDARFEDAMVYLPKNGDIDKIAQCAEWDFAKSECVSGWQLPYLTFGQNDTYVWFLVDHFSAYAGVSIEILNAYSYPKNGDVWVVDINTTGRADLIVYPYTATSFEEMPDDDEATPDELEFRELKCNDELLNENLYANTTTGIKRHSDLSGSERINSLVYYNYSCLGIGYFSSMVNIPGYATLMFQFGNDTAFAYDPPSNGYVCSNDILCEYLNLTAAFIGENNTNTTITITEGGNWNSALTLMINKTVYNDNGYAIYINATTPTILNCNQTTIIGNGTGYGISVDSHNITITNCTIH